MPWLAESDIGAARRLGQGIVDSRTEVELRRRALHALVELVPADVLTWDCVELATGAVRHDAVPVDVERPGVFEAVVGSAARHPLLAAHVAGRRAAVRLSELVELGLLRRSELYGDLLHRSGVEYEIAIGMRTDRGEVVVAALGRTECEFSERDRDYVVGQRVARGSGLCASRRPAASRRGGRCGWAADRQASARPRPRDRTRWPQNRCAQ